MSDLYDRKLSLVVANDAEARDLSALHVKFNVRQWSLQQPGTMTARIYNVSEATAQAVQKEFTRVVLQAGYQEGEFGVIFDGTIVQIRRGRENATDTYLDIIAAHGDAYYNYAIASYSIPAGSNSLMRLQKAVAALGIPAGAMPDNLPAATLPRGKVVHDMARDTVRQESDALGATWNIQDGKVNVIADGGYLPGQAVALNAESGMIGLPQQTVEGVTVRSLLNAKLRANGVVQINRASIQTATLNQTYQGATANSFLPAITEDGFYRIVQLEYSGDTRGNDWYSDMVCIALGQPATQQLVDKGYA